MSSSGAPSAANRTQRHLALYSQDEPIVIDPGSLVWKVGFGSEHEPRACFPLDQHRHATASASAAHGTATEQASYIAIQAAMRYTFEHVLLIDPKPRTVLLVESPFMTRQYKHDLTKALLENLQVTSMSFAPASLLSLLATGRTTGLVVDIGGDFTTVTPVFATRPIYASVMNTRRASKWLTRRLRSLLARHARFLPTPELSSRAPPSSTAHWTRVPDDLLTDANMHDLQARSLFCDARAATVLEEAQLHSLAETYKASATASDSYARVRVEDDGGLLQIPGWIRECAAETLLAESDEDDLCLPELILTCLAKLPIDLRRTMASNILITGGSAAIPGLITRLHLTTLAMLARSTYSGGPRRPSHANRFSSLLPLSNAIAFLNDPTPAMHGNVLSGTSTPFASHLLAWTGGAIASSLRSSGMPLARSEWRSDHVLAPKVKMLSPMQQACKRQATSMHFARSFQTAPRAFVKSSTAIRAGAVAAGSQGPYVKGTVNDPTTFPPPSKSHGSYHWTFERFISAALVPVLGATVVTSPNPMLDGVLAVTLVIHSHLGFDQILIDYLHDRKFPIIGPVARWGVRLATVGVLVGLYQFNTNDIGKFRLHIQQATFAHLSHCSQASPSSPSESGRHDVPALAASIVLFDIVQGCMALTGLLSTNCERTEIRLDVGL
ncbi:uncharacterized protein L969DRAFT_93938 [Mixia osmundae IAM 14324]|uniref:Succinate dehydrogenase [ubiquinone] cytochrome b small subunit n=1 Tax=Mixia osmundae (strain CBS 9802 / IAM 14324 / JCM 22182 / KY 12970) TaxID=764103 RepID=G7E8L0_MIXOS|nr:uncharacterized protein L969DRAFT_93938 [Mixia osmundae IAM 14324]KEI40112.1 hypothetical protein L969DRAFT_93938 [Mixia osmundae IAM 14324]GAA99478.1 hypothetical protein E5Q_06177 [Mixia osmundae IAM 14324]